MKLGADAFKSLPLAGATILIVAIAALGAVYWNSVQELTTLLTQLGSRGPTLPKATV